MVDTKPYQVVPLGGPRTDLATLLLIRWRVLRALFLKDLQVRFGAHHYGYLWIFVEAAAHITFFVLLFRWRGTHQIGDIAMPIFITTGVVPYFAVTHIVHRIPGAITANRSLFVYRQVQPTDAILARTALELFLMYLTFFVAIAICEWLGFSVHRMPSARLIFTLFAMGMIGFGLGCLAAVATMYNENFENLTSWILRPFYFVSGLFFVADQWPEATRRYLLWNPVLNGLEIVREELFGPPIVYHGSDAYLWSSAMLIGIGGFLAFFAGRRRALLISL